MSVVPYLHVPHPRELIKGQLSPKEDHYTLKSVTVLGLVNVTCIIPKNKKITHIIINLFALTHTSQLILNGGLGLQKPLYTTYMIMNLMIAV